MIDTPYVTVKESASTRIEAMDGTGLFKDKYPNEYKKMVAKPMLETLFVATDTKSAKLAHSFRIDPMKGEISFPIYPPSAEAIPNVIREILSNN